MSDEAENPRERLGGNNPPLGAMIGQTEGDFAAITSDYLADAFAKQIEIATSLLGEARDLPKEIPDDETKGKFTSLIKRLRDHSKTLTALHVAQKTPYLRGGQAVDQYFFGTIDKLARRVKTNNPGAADILNNRLTEYDNKILAAEQARRQREADEAAKDAREAAQKAEAERLAEEKRVREAEEAALAAERARNPERREEKAAVAEAAHSAAQDQGQKADAATVDAQVALGKAQEAHLATTAKAADIMRTRGEDGTLSTMGTEKFAEILDFEALDSAKLWPYISADAKQKAVTAFARATDYRVAMPGCSIGRRNKSTVR